MSRIHLVMKLCYYKCLHLTRINVLHCYFCYGFFDLLDNFNYSP